MITKDEIIRMARKVWGEQAILPFDDLERFAVLVAAKAAEKERERIEHAAIGSVKAAILYEREACAKVCDELRHPYGYSAETQDWVDGTIQSADAIRSRGNREK